MKTVCAETVLQQHQREQQAGVSDAEKNSSENLEDLKSEKNNTKAEAKEAQRVARKADAAARESRSTYRAEKRRRGRECEPTDGLKKQRVQGEYPTADRL